MKPASTEERAPSIPRRPAILPEHSFEALRDEGIRLLQKLSGTTWTDHNLHDPGITMLEALVYSLTDLAYRADFPVADHLTGPDGSINFEALALHPPHRAFPCRATTAGDRRRWLIDQVDALDDVTFAAGPMPGVWRLSLELAQRSAGAADPQVAAARAAWRAQRNLCEDLDSAFTVIEPVPCELHADIEIGGPRDPADVLAEIYDRCMRHIAQSPQLHNLHEERASGRSLEQIYTGPATQHGFLAGRDLDDLAEPRLFVGTLADVVKAVEGVRELRWLALQSGREPPTAGSLAWRGEGWELRLRVPGGPGDGVPGCVTLMRRGLVVALEPALVYGKVLDLQTAGRARRAPVDAAHEGDVMSGLPHGTYRELGRFLSVQEHFPPVYGLGRHGVTASAGIGRLARVRQLQGYLLLLEQMVAHGAALVQHQRELFSTALTPRRSYWWNVPGEAEVPGADALYLAPRETIAATTCDPFDAFIERKGRVLDHLLALHGETWAQGSMRQFMGHLEPDEADRMLLAAKAAFTQQVVTLGRDRGGAFDDARASWNRDDNTAGLQRRLSLLLGFRQEHSRSLTDPLRRQNRTLGGPGGARPLDANLLATALVPARLAEADRARLGADLARIEPLRGNRLDGALLGAGSRRDRYRLAPPQREGDPWTLMLLHDTPRHGWVLAEAADADEGARIAEHLRRFLVHLNHESEGLHLVEHVLLRPTGRGDGHRHLGVTDDFYPMRLSVVLPDWSVRTASADFRRFAQETVQINAPAHVLASCCWLDFGRMERFEQHWLAWLQARMAFHATPVPTTATLEALDAASCAVIGDLLDTLDADGTAMPGHA